MLKAQGQMLNSSSQRIIGVISIGVAVGASGFLCRKALYEATSTPGSVKEFGLGAVWTWGHDSV